MKTVLQDIDFKTFVQHYDEAIQQELNLITSQITSRTQKVPQIWGKDIIGFGHMTYSNSYVKDQPFFLFGLKVTHAGYTLYLNMYDALLFNYASVHHIKHGQGCYYFKRHQKDTMDPMLHLIQISLN
jgi:hypothetical protein